MNTCHSGAITGRMCGNTRAVTVGWSEYVDDNMAADFALALYQHLLNGTSVAEAVHAFVRSIWLTEAGRELWRTSGPAVAFPDRAWLDWRPFDRQADAQTSSADAASGLQPAAQPAAQPAELVEEASKGPWLQVEFTPVPAMNPALLFNGRPPIEHIVLTSPRAQTVRLRIDCDTGSAMSSYRQTLVLEPGPHPMTAITREVYFPALHELVDRRARRRRILLTLTVESADGSLRTEITKSVQWMGAEEWIDAPETWKYIPAFVNPFDPAVAAVVRRAVAVLRMIGEPHDDFDGYAAIQGRADRPARQIQAIFQTLRDDVPGIRYSQPAGGEMYAAGQSRASGQFVRRHREVIEQRLGACHDLRLLMAACAEYVTIHPIVVLVSEHTFFGFWTDPVARQRFWQVENSPSARLVWMIADGRRLRSLLTEGSMRFVDAVDLCQPRSFADACRNGAARLDAALSNPTLGFDVALDIERARKGGIQSA